LNFKDILELIDKVSEKGIGSVEIEQAGTKIKIEGKPAQQHVFAAFSGEMKRGDQPELPAAIPVAALADSPAVAAAKAADRKAAEDDASEAGLHIITSPIVGTFYRAPNPEASSFVNVGDRISKGKVLCIIEAMKLMNEIESDIDGVITRVYPQNGQPVEYGEKLFAVKV
jgi:acetyl-CoA carboxylase biotin carboxyl carrier protein